MNYPGMSEEAKAFWQARDLEAREKLEHGEPIASAPRPFPRLFAADESDAELVAKQREIRAAKESVHGGAMSDSLATVLQPMETKAYLDLRRQAGAKFSRGPERDRGLQGLVH